MIWEEEIYFLCFFIKLSIIVKQCLSGVTFFSKGSFRISTMSESDFVCPCLKVVCLCLIFLDARLLTGLDSF